jgi:hypothetical protein
MIDPLRKDYEAIATMIFGEVPSFEAVLESIARAEERLNAALMLICGANYRRVSTRLRDAAQAARVSLSARLFEISSIILAHACIIARRSGIYVARL